MAKILGMGNALVDIMTQLDKDSILQDFNLPKGSMQLVDKDLSKKIKDGTTQFKKQLASGGSAANTIHGLAKMGIDTAFFGTIGKDDMGDFFKLDMENSKVDTKLFYGEGDTGVAIALVSPDSERTFAVHLGAAIELAPIHISENLFNGYDYFHIEGYLVQNQALIKKAVEVAKASGLKVCLDLASYNVVEANLEFLKSLVKNYVDIVFANEEEARAFTGKAPREALDIIAADCEIAIVKTGKEGSLIKKGNEVFTVGIINVTPIDTTGAGDLYASGFLYGLALGYTLDKCGKIGAVLSGKVIEVIGAKMDKNRWDEAHRMIKEIIK